MLVGRGGTASAIIGSRIYLLGGNLGATVVTRMDTYDIPANAWNTAPPMLQTRTDPATAVINGKLWVFGGFSQFGGVYLDSIEVFDPATNGWTMLSLRMPEKREVFAAAADSNGVFLIGGQEGSTSLASSNILFLSLSSNVWTTNTVLPEPRLRAYSCLVGGRIYYIGGAIRGTNSNRVDIYDIASDTWRIGTPLQQARAYHTVSVVGSSVYVIGGGKPGIPDAHTSVEVYDTTTDLVFNAPSMNHERAATTAQSFGNSIFVLGGYSGQRGYQKTVERYVVPGVPAGAPIITTQPQSTTVTATSNAVFTVAVSGAAPFAYQWRKGAVDIVNATNASLTITGALPADVGNYSVFIRNLFGTATSQTAQLAIQPLVITQQPTLQRVVPGTNATFSVSATGPGPFTYQWRFNGASLTGATNASLTLTNVQVVNNGAYHVVVGNSFGTVPSAAATLEVLTPPVITAHPDSVAALAGDVVSFAVSHSGSTPFTYQWQLNGTNLPGATGSTLTLASVRVTDAGLYSVVVSNPVASVASSNATLTVSSPPVIVIPPAARVVSAATPVPFTVLALGDAPLTYQWRRDGQVIPGATNASYSIAAAAPAHEGLYTVVVSNALGFAVSPAARLTVLPLSVVVPWVAAGGGPGTDVGNAIAVDAAGNSVVAGYFMGTANFGTNTLVSAGVTDIFVARYNAAGQVLWARRAGGPGYDTAKGVALDTGGNIYVTGAYEGVADFGTNSLTNTTLTSYSDIFLARYDAAGNSVWARSAGAEFAHDEGTAVAVDGVGNVLVAGRSVLETFAGVPVANTGRILVAKFTSAGTEVWAWKAGSYSGGNLDIATGVAADGAGNVLVTGTFHSPLAAFGGGTFTNRGNSDIFLARLDSAGTLQWTRQAGGAGEDTASGVALAADGSAYVAGATGGAGSFSPTNNVASLAGAFTDGFVAKYAGDGGVTWVRQFGGAGVAAARGVAVDAAGTVHLTGYFSGAATFGTNSLNGITGSYDAFLARLDAAGNVAFAQQAGGADLSGDFGLAVGVDGAGNSVITGYFSGTSTAGGGTLASAGGEDVLLTRFNQFVGGGVPAMGFQRLGGQLRMRWPLAASSYILQSTTNLLAPVWVDETNALNLSGTDLETDVPVGNTIRFYRLRKP